MVLEGRGLKGDRPPQGIRRRPADCRKPGRLRHRCGASPCPTPGLAATSCSHRYRSPAARDPARGQSLGASALGRAAWLGRRWTARGVERLGARLRTPRASAGGAVRRGAPAQHRHRRRAASLGDAPLPALPGHRARWHTADWPADRLLRAHPGRPTPAQRHPPHPAVRAASQSAQRPALVQPAADRSRCHCPGRAQRGGAPPSPRRWRGRPRGLAQKRARAARKSPGPTRPRAGARPVPAALHGARGRSTRHRPRPRARGRCARS